MDEAHETAVRKLLKNAPIPFKVVTETLFKVLTNVINSSQDPKYLELKRTSTTFSEKIANCAGGVAFLRAAGFVTDGDVMRLPKPVNVEKLQRSRAILKDAVKQYGAKVQEEQQRENTEAAMKLRDLQEATRKRRSKIDADAAAERANILRGVQIDRDDWSRQRDPNNLR